MRHVLAGCLLLCVLAGCDRPAPTQAPPTGTAEPASPAPGDTAANDTQADIDDPVAIEDDGEGEPEPLPDGIEPTPPELPAPWSAAPLAAADVPAVYLQQWRKADNRASCALLAPTTKPGDAKPRAANFSGGWAVAYDEPGLRSAFGIAGTGVVADGDSFHGWDDAITWADGSAATWGPEGGTGPDHLAYVVVQGQGCLYNVWSKHGSAHLFELVESLRFVTSPPPGE